MKNPKSDPKFGFNQHHNNPYYYLAQKLVDIVNPHGNASNLTL
jgi:hypothetical protein